MCITFTERAMWTKRLLSMALVFAMVLSLLPAMAVPALAAEATDSDTKDAFGISTPEQAQKMAGLSDGAIVGSAIVKLLAQYGREAVPHVAEYVKQMKDAVRLA